MAVGIGGNDDKVRGRGQPRVKPSEPRVACQFVGQLHLGPVDQPDDLGIGKPVVRQGMRQPHIAKTCNQNTGHLTAPDVSPRISCREKMT